MNKGGSSHRQLEMLHVLCKLFGFVAGSREPLPIYSFRLTCNFCSVSGQPFVNVAGCARYMLVTCPLPALVVLLRANLVAVHSLSYQWLDIQPEIHQCGSWRSDKITHKHLRATTYHTNEMSYCSPCS